MSSLPGKTPPQPGTPVTGGGAPASSLPGAARNSSGRNSPAVGSAGAVSSGLLPGAAVAGSAPPAAGVDKTGSGGRTTPGGLGVPQPPTADGGLNKSPPPPPPPSDDQAAAAGLPSAKPVTPPNTVQPTAGAAKSATPPNVVAGGAAGSGLPAPAAATDVNNQQQQQHQQQGVTNNNNNNNKSPTLGGTAAAASDPNNAPGSPLGELSNTSFSQNPVPNVSTPSGGQQQQQQQQQPAPNRPLAQQVQGASEMVELALRAEVKRLREENLELRRAADRARGLESEASMLRDASVWQLDDKAPIRLRQLELDNHRLRRKCQAMEERIAAMELEKANIVAMGGGGGGGPGMGMMGGGSGAAPAAMESSVRRQQSSSPTSKSQRNPVDEAATGGGGNSANFVCTSCKLKISVNNRAWQQRMEEVRKENTELRERLDAATAELQAIGQWVTHVVNIHKQYPSLATASGSSHVAALLGGANEHLNSFVRQ